MNLPVLIPPAFRRRAWGGFLLLILSAFFALPSAWAQDGEAADSLDQSETAYGSGMGLEVILTNSGFGLGAYRKWAVSPTTSVMAELTLAPGKDEREFKFASFYRTSVPNKANYLIMVPVTVGVLRRLFRDHIEDNFRPYLQVTTGPTFGWEYPYFRDCNGNGTFETDLKVGNCRERSYDAIGAIPRGHSTMGIGGNIALGAHFGSSKRIAQGVRLGYTFTYFFNEVQLLEPGIENAAQRFFGTPSISLTFGRLF
jgi:hypothetical protein